MGTETTRDGRRTDTAPTPPEVTDEAIREMFDRAFDTERPEAPPESPEITADDVLRMFADAGLFPSEDTVETPEPTPVDATPTPSPTLRETQCPSCYGSGTQVCSSCYGSGYRTTSYTTTDWEGNVEYVTDQYPCGCSAGTVACGACGGRGTVSR